MMPGQQLLKVKRLHPRARLPERATAGSSGLDLFACIDEPGCLVIGRQPVRVGTGIAIEFPAGFDAQVRPRSGLSAKGVGVTFGTIDSDYRGEVLVTMYVYGEQGEYRINHGDRIAQLVFTRLADLPLSEVSELGATARGDGGHGSTGH
jgi:dUTP pyrophosphatase